MSRYDDARTFSATALIITLVVVVGILMLAYFAWWAPRREATVIHTTPAPSPPTVVTPVPGSPGPPGPPGPPGQPGAPGQPPIIIDPPDTDPPPQDNF